MAIERLIIGSNNPAKLDEWKKLLDKHFEVKSVSDLGIFPEPTETGNTFAENASLKAKHYAILVREFVLGDDSGFEIDALGGAPGIKSRRILPGDKEGTDEQIVDYVLTKMKGVPKEKRTARLVVHAAVAGKDGNIIYTDTDSINGFVTDKLAAPIIPGFPYRSIFFLPEVGKVFANITEEEHDKLNHRKRIAERLSKFLLKYKHA